MDKITGVLDALQKIFGKGFLLAGFLPILTLLMVSWVLGCWVSVACRELSEYLLRAKVTQQMAIGTLLLLVLSIGSFVFWLLNPWFRQTLEGRILPLRIQDWLAQQQRKRLQAVRNDLQVFLTEVGRYRQARAQWPTQLAAASTGTGANVQDGTLIAAYDALKDDFDGFQPVPFERAQGFYNRLVAELAVTSTTAVPGLGEVRDGLRDTLIPAGQASAERLFYRRLTDRTFQYPAEDVSVGPTCLANVQEAQRDYIARNYGIDVSVFWTDLQKIAAADEKFAATLENAKIRLDFSVAMTAAAVLFTVGWIVVNILFGSDLWIYTGVTILGVFTSVMFHQLVFISYATFGETVRTTVELCRFDLLKALHITLPANDATEQRIWLDLASRLETGAQIAIPYDHA